MGLSGFVASCRFTVLGVGYRHGVWVAGVECSVVWWLGVGCQRGVVGGGKKIMKNELFYNILIVK